MILPSTQIFIPEHRVSPSTPLFHPPLSLSVTKFRRFSFQNTFETYLCQSSLPPLSLVLMTEKVPKSSI